jgi:hypothetical protein
LATASSAGGTSSPADTEQPKPRRRTKYDELVDALADASSS